MSQKLSCRVLIINGLIIKILGAHGGEYEDDSLLEYGVRVVL
jgi:hypothetical protein